MHVIWSDFRKEREIVTKTVFEQPKSERKNDNLKNVQKSPGINHLKHSKWQEAAVFQDINLKFHAHIHR